MVLFNYSTKELTAKVVYYGPGLCGKTTNLQWIHEKLPIKNKGKMLSLATETDRTLFFDFLPIELGAIRGMRTRIQLYTVPGQVFYNATRRMVLKGADCVVFVADSQEPMLDANVESMENLRQNLEANEIDADEIPTVIQYNKRDLPNALPLEIMNARLNTRDRPFFEAVAIKGQGVEETLKGVTTLVFRSLASKYGASGEAVQQGTPTTAPSTPRTGTAPRVPAPERPPAASATVAAPAPPGLRPPAPPAAAAAQAAPAAPRPEPAPLIQPRPAPVNVGARDTIPPLPLESEDDYDEDLLESLHLSPEDELMVEDPAPEDLSLEDEEPLDVVEEEAPASRRPARVGAETVASTPREAEVLRQRIARPLDGLDLERIEEEEQEVEEISLESPEPAAVSAPAFRPFLEEDLFADAAPAPQPAPAPQAAAAPVAIAAAPAPAPPAPVAAAVPVSVDLVASGPGTADVAIPVEIVLNNGTAQVNLHVRLTLNLKIQQ